MSSCLKKYLILIFILCVMLLIYFYQPLNFPRYMLSSSSYAPNFDGFSGIKISDLIKTPEFYFQKREKTINYLLSIYPLGKESFQKLNDLQLASFYNSLNYYHACHVSLPYPPQGWFFNFYTYKKYNFPRIFSDSNEEREELRLENFISESNGIIQRDIWFPNGLSITKIGEEDVWQYVFNKKISWNYPNKWFEGIKDNNFIEVINSKPLAQSLGWWWQCVTGSGVFLDVGKSLRVKNKLDAVYTLLKKMNKDFLKKYFGNEDIYDIIYNLIVKCLCNDKYTNCDCEPDYEGVLKESGLPVKNFENELKRFQKRNNIKDYKEAFQKSIHAAINNLDYRLNRINSKISLDETIFFLGINTGYDTIQLSQDPNINGYYIYKIIDLRIPKEYLKNAKEREYSDFINIKEDPNDNQYTQEFVQKFIDKVVNEEILTVRDPLDIFNKRKVQKVIL
jgi:hypothetical protein